MYAIIWITRKWKVYCTRKPIIQSDHLSLQSIRKQKDPRHKLARWITELEGVDCKIEFLQGKENIEADCLSRVLYEIDDDPAVHPEVVYNMESSPYPSIDTIKKHQRLCPDLGEVIKCLIENKEIEAGPYKNYNNLDVQDGVLYKGLRVVIPEELQEAIIKEVHGQHHVGAPNTLELCKNRFYWKGMTWYVDVKIAYSVKRVNLIKLLWLPQISDLQGLCLL